MSNLQGGSIKVCAACTMLRKKAMIRAALTQHVSFVMKTQVYDALTFKNVPPVVLHLSLERLKDEPLEKLLHIMNNVYISNQKAFLYLIRRNNSVIKRIQKS